MRRHPAAARPARPRRAAVLVALVACASCSPRAIVEVTIGPFDYEVSASQVVVPDAFRDPDTMAVRRIPCSDDASCPQLGAGQPAVRCVEMVCDPEPFSFDLGSSVIDIEQNDAVRRYGDRITSIEILDAAYTAIPEGLQNPVGPTEIFWGPEDATSPESPGARLLGTIPQLDLSGGATLDGRIDVDAAGSTALSAHLLTTSRRMRLFGRPRVDLAPGGPLPSGGVRLQVRLTVRIDGQLIR